MSAYNEHGYACHRHPQEVIKDGRTDFNVMRPHMSVDGLTPVEFPT